VNNLVLSLISTVLIGLGATLTFDLWAIFVKHAFKITPSNICLVGRWLRYMPEGTFKHSNIVSAPQKSAECMVGSIAHYIIGVMFAIPFVALVGNSWLQHPTLIPAIIFGVVTVLAPFFIMQPSFGLGFAALKMSNPTQARLRSLMNHTVFGIGLYLFGLLVSWLL
jgi:energy-converting hydrogenase Eha subunit B